jgi:hypothetical protein
MPRQQNASRLLSHRNPAVREDEEVHHSNSSSESHFAKQIHRSSN